MKTDFGSKAVPRLCLALNITKRSFNWQFLHLFPNSEEKSATIICKKFQGEMNTFRKPGSEE